MLLFCLTGGATVEDRADATVFQDEQGVVRIRLLGIGALGTGTTGEVNCFCILNVNVGGETVQKRIYRKGDSIPMTGFTVLRVTVSLVELVSKDKKVVLKICDTERKPELPAGADSAGRGAAQP